MTAPAVRAGRRHRRHSVLGRWLGAYWPLLGHDYVTLGVGTPWTLNLAVAGLALGAWVHLNLGGLAGIGGGCSDVGAFVRGGA